MTQKQRALPAQTEALKYLILDVLKDEKIYHWHEVYRKIYKKVRIQEQQLENPRKRLRKAGKITYVSLNKKLKDKYGFQYGWVIVKKNKSLPLGTVENRIGYTAQKSYPKKIKKNVPIAKKTVTIPKWGGSETKTVSLSNDEIKELKTLIHWKQRNVFNDPSKDLNFTFNTSHELDEDIKKRGTETVTFGKWDSDTTKNGGKWSISIDNDNFKKSNKFNKYIKNLWTAIKGEK